MIRMKKYWLALVLACVLCMPLIAHAEDKPAAPADPNLEAVAIELPEPFFGGTPLDYWGPNLEPEDYRDRPPFMAPKGTTNVARGKAVTSSAPPVHGELKQITDGDKNYARTSLIELPAGAQWVQIDLEKECNIYAVLVWHFHEGKRVYFDFVVQVSNDKEFNDKVNVVYNSDHDNSAGLGVGKDKEYIENYKGRLIDTKGVSGRYVRLYTKGNTADDFNHYVEVEVYGIPKAAS
jgi:hypothetical protein